jgi:hypothetical protein
VSGGETRKLGSTPTPTVAARGSTKVETEALLRSTSGSMPPGFVLPTGCGRPGSKSRPPRAGPGFSPRSNISRSGREERSK